MISSCIVLMISNHYHIFFTMIDSTIVCEKLIGSKLLMRIWEERIKRTAHQQLHLAVLTIVNTIYKYFGIQSNMAFFSSKTAKIDATYHAGIID